MYKRQALFLALVAGHHDGMRLERRDAVEIKMLYVGLPRWWLELTRYFAPAGDARDDGRGGYVAPLQGAARPADAAAAPWSAARGALAAVAAGAAVAVVGAYVAARARKARRARVAAPMPLTASPKLVSVHVQRDATEASGLLRRGL